MKALLQQHLTESGIPGKYLVYFECYRQEKCPAWLQVTHCFPCSIESSECHLVLESDLVGRGYSQAMASFIESIYFVIET
jgi:hypothetical protein